MNISNKEMLDIEFDLFKIFTLKATEYQEVPDKDFYALALAQHHGLATRLLDWTTDPFVALFFSVDSLVEKDGIVYAYEHKYNIRTKIDIKEFEAEEIDAEVGQDVIKNPRYPANFFFLPPIISPRISAQSGILQAFPNPLKAFEDENLVEIVIKKELKKKIKESLNLYGYNQYRLFPTLDYLCDYLNDNNIMNKKNR